MKISISNTVCITFIIAALALHGILLEPALEDAQMANRHLSATHAEIMQQQRTPLTDAQLALHAYLLNTEDEETFIHALNEARLQNQLENVAYAIAPRQSEGPYSIQKLDLTFSAPSDTGIFAFFNTVSQGRATKIESLRMTRNDTDTPEVTAVAALKFYRWQ
jgi:hypothetical protein